MRTTSSAHRGRSLVESAGTLTVTCVLICTALGCVEDPSRPAEPVDTAAPVPIADLAVHATETHGLTLRWTAPAEDGSGGGKVAGYEVRRSNRPITEANFGAATAVAAPNPAEPGIEQSLAVSNLTPATEYVFALRAVDEAGNRAPISNLAYGRTAELPDTIPPGQVSDLIAWFRAPDAIVVHWSAPSEDGRDGTAVAAYELRWSREPITPTNFESAAILTTPGPETPRSDQSSRLEGLAPSTPYWLALRSTDAAGNVSPISNICATETTEPGVLQAAPQGYLPRFNPDGRRLGYMRPPTDRARPRVVDLQTGRDEPLPFTQGRDVYSMDWHPRGDGYLLVEVSVWQPRVSFTHFHANGSSAEILSPKSRVGFPRWSPTGNAILYGGSPFEIVDPIGRSIDSIDLPEGSGLWHGWSPTASEIILSGRGTPERTFLVFDLRTRAARTIPGTTDGMAPDWSPDGTEIAYHVGSDRGASIYLISADGGEPRKVIDGERFGGAIEAAWSPEGTRLAFMWHEVWVAEIPR